MAQFDNFSPPEFEHWLTCYYRNQENQKIDKAINYYTRLAPNKRTSLTLPLAAFFAAMFKEDSNIMYRVFHSLSKSDSIEKQRLLLYSLWLVNTPQSKDLINQSKVKWKNQLKNVFSRVIGNAAPDILKEPIQSTQELDMLWMTFFANGRKETILKIVSLTPLVRRGQGFELILGQIAKETLLKNAIDHPRVLMILKDELPSSKELEQEILEEIVAKIHSLL